MQIEIFHGGALIGRAILDASDPPMGVASGPFEPFPSYHRELHAGEIEGVYNPTAANSPFFVQAADGGAVECQYVFIQDYSDGLGERQASVVGIPYPEYEVRFGDYAAFKAYWANS